MCIPGVGTSLRVLSLLKGNCAEIVSRVSNADGFELLRKFARKFDTISPQAVRICKARVLAFDGQPCTTFAKTVERLHELEKLRGDMGENTGEDTKEDIWAEVSDHGRDVPV